MNVTGIVRRIDDLGRVVIPKELRQLIQIKEGDPCEIFTTREGGIYLKKYNPNDESIPEEPETTTKTEPIEERKLVCVTDDCNVPYYYNLTNTQIKFLQALVNDEIIDGYELVAPHITTP